jgi:hypothetical protein
MKTESDAREEGGRRRAPGACVIVVAPLVTETLAGIVPCRSWFVASFANSRCVT